MSLMVMLSFVTGCSTIFGRHQDEQMVMIDANVADVEVNCSGRRVETPGSIPLKQSKSHSCTAKKDGYEKKVFKIRSGTSWAGFGHSTAMNTAAWGWWTLGIGTGVGWLIDWPSGAMKNLKEDSFYLEMKPEGSTSTASKVASSVVNTGKAVVQLPVELVDNTTDAVLDTTVYDSAKKMGVEEPQWEGDSKKV